MSMGAHGDADARGVQCFGYGVGRGQPHRALWVVSGVLWVWKLGRHTHGAVPWGCGPAVPWGRDAPPRLLPSLRRERGLCAVAAPSGAGVSLPWHERAFQEGLRPGSASGNRSRGGPPAAGRTMPVCARHLGGTRWHCTSAGCERGGGAHPIPGAPQNAAAPWVPLGSPLRGYSVWCPRARIEEHPKWVHHWGAEAQIKESTPVSGCAVLLQEAGGWHQGAGTQPAARPQGVQQTHPLRHRLPGVPRWPGGSPLLPAHPQEASDR